jgi:organic hydroperoxide reductase OsmC/OhrA
VQGAPQPKVLEFDVTVDSDLAARSGRGGPAIAADDAWSSEHLVLAALVRCTLTSLDHHTKRDGLTATAAGSARGTVTKRESDGRYAFVDVEASYEVELADVPDHAAVIDLLDRAERGCFVGNSLAARPTYHWTVNGEEIR